MADNSWDYKSTNAYIEDRKLFELPSERAKRDAANRDSEDSEPAANVENYAAIYDEQEHIESIEQSGYETNDAAPNESSNVDVFGLARFKITEGLSESSDVDALVSAQLKIVKGILKVALLISVVLITVSIIISLVSKILNDVTRSSSSIMSSSNKASIEYAMVEQVDKDAYAIEIDGKDIMFTPIYTTYNDSSDDLLSI